MSKQFRLAAIALIAGAMMAIATGAALAFSQQTVSPTGNYDFNYGPLDDKAKLKGDTNKFDADSPGFHFSVESGQTDRFGFHHPGSSINAGPPDYSRPLGNGD